MQLTIGYSDSEDRLWLLFADDGTQLWLTRRLTCVLLKRMAERMTVSCPSAGDDYSLKPEIRVALEYEAAHELPADPDLQDAAPEQATITHRSVHQLTSISLKVAANRVQMEAIGPGFRRPLLLSRAEAHRLLGALVRRSIAADWNLPPLPDWLPKDGGGTKEE
jgi:hypothetical protein